MTVDPENVLVADEEPLEGPEYAPPEAQRGFIAEWAVTIILLLFGTTNLVQAFVIPTGSMEDTLLIGDHLLVDKLAFSPSGPVSKHILPYTEVKRGDIIVFRYPVEIQQTFVKRCIGVPSEPNVHVADAASDMLNNHVVSGEVVVPPGFYFAMGDNRDSSLDSRYWGFVPGGNIIGKPLIIYWSYDASTEALSKPMISVDHLLDLVQHFPTKTRWRRCFRLIRGYPLK